MSRIFDYLKAGLTQNIGLKLFALAASIILFSLVHGAEDAQRSIFVDVVAILPGADADKILISDWPDRVRVTMRGSRSLLNSISRDELDAVQVDLTDPELSYYYFEPESFELPVGVEIVQLAPDSIPLSWQDRVQREVDVEPVINGQPGDGLSLSEPVVEPEAVRVDGAQNEIDTLTAVRTEAVNVRGLGAGSYERTVRLEPAGRHVTFGQRGSVTVRFQVVPERDERQLMGLEVEAIGPSARLRPATVDITVRGAPELIAGLSGDRVVPWVDSAADELATGGTRPLPVQLRGLPEGVEVLSVDPAEVLVARVPTAPSAPRPGTP